MTLWQSLSFSEPDQLVPLARCAEECGFHGVLLSDHLAFPRDLASKYPYAPDGRPTFDAPSLRDAREALRRDDRGDAQALDGPHGRAPRAALRLPADADEPRPGEARADLPRRRVRGSAASGDRARRRLDGPGQHPRGGAPFPARLRELRKRAGREAEPFTAIVPLKAQLDRDLLRRMEEQGVTDTVSYPFAFALGPASLLEKKRDHLKRTAEALLGRG